MNKPKPVPQPPVDHTVPLTRDQARRELGWDLLRPCKDRDIS